MPVADVNLVFVVVAAAANMVLGALWYSPILFAKQWTALTGKTDMTPGEGAVIGYVVAAIASLITAYVLAHFLDYTQADTWMEGVVTAFWIWVGFVFTSFVTQYMFEGRRKQLLAINSGYVLVGLVIMSVILTLWS